MMTGQKGQITMTVNFTNLDNYVLKMHHENDYEMASCKALIVDTCNAYLEKMETKMQAICTDWIKLDEQCEKLGINWFQFIDKKSDPLPVEAFKFLLEKEAYLHGKYLCKDVIFTDANKIQWIECLNTLSMLGMRYKVLPANYENKTYIAIISK